jgi:hypothetical protein
MFLSQKTDIDVSPKMVILQLVVIMDDSDNDCYMSLTLSILSAPAQKLYIQC